MPETQSQPKDSPQEIPQEVPQESLKDNRSDDPIGNEDLKKVLEGLLFITDHPLAVKELCKLSGLLVKEQPRVLALVTELQKDLDEKGSPLQLLAVAEGYQMGTRKEYAPFVRKLFAERMTLKLSTAAHETLSIIAYKQPLTRAEIEQIRGVEVIAALETLLEKRLIKVVGRKETVGRPLMYGTTIEFLRHFGLQSLEQLPALDSFKLPEPAAGVPADALQEAAAAGEAVDAEAAPAETAPEAEDTEPVAAAASDAPSDEKPSAGAKLWPSDDEDPPSGQ